MALWSTFFPGPKLISRTMYGYQASPYAIVAPPGATIIRASMVGGGANQAGAAFARVKAACTPGEGFTLSVGNCAATLAGAGGNTVLTRDTGSVIICRADGAENGVAGSVAGSIGDTKRAGSVYVSGLISGASAGDDADPYPLGYGGDGALIHIINAGSHGNDWRYAYPGAGGWLELPGIWGEEGGPGKWSIYPGQGRATVEFFKSDPGYS